MIFSLSGESKHIYLNASSMLEINMKYPNNVGVDAYQLPIRVMTTSKLRVTGRCGGNSPVTGEIPAQRASDAENISIRWRHHEMWRHYVWSSLYPTAI